MSAKSGKVIITCAVTGSIHTPTMSDALPVTPNEIAEQAIAAAEAGAAILHLHARDPQDGRPTPDPKVFMQFLPRIKQSCEAVVNITTGGSVKMSLGEPDGQHHRDDKGEIPNDPQQPALLQRPVGAALFSRHLNLHEGSEAPAWTTTRRLSTEYHSR